MGARIFCKFGRMKGLEADLVDEIHVGRGKDNELCILHKMVSSKHARIYRDKETSRYMLEDLDSLNGTLLDGTRITEPEVLGHLHVVNFGGASDFFFVDATNTPASTGPMTRRPINNDTDPPVTEKAKEEDKRNTFFGEAFAPTPSILAQPQAEVDDPDKARQTWTGAAPAIVPDILKKKEPKKPKKPKERDTDSKNLVPCLVITNWRERPVIFPLKDGENIIGRSSDLTMQIDHDQISRRHATITLFKGRLYISDDGSTNKTFHEGEEVEGQIEIKPGSHITFGKIKGKIVLRTKTDDE